MTTRAEAEAKLIKGETLCDREECRRPIRQTPEYWQSFCSQRCADLDAERDDEAQSFDPLDDEIVGPPGTPGATRSGLRADTRATLLRTYVPPDEDLPF